MKTKSIPKFFRMIGITFFSLACLAPAAHAEVVLDGSLGQKGAVSGPDYVITDKMGSQVGNNLFHSFETFNINTGESGTFTGPGGVQNVIGRVTGGTSSWIDGRLGCSIPGANLFLINPYGMMFGPNATLDVNGSFHASTADYLLLGDAGRFDAVHPEQSVLTVDPPSAFGFLDDTAAPITMEGCYLQVPEGETLSMVGGDITMIGANLVSKGGLINLTAVASKGEARFDDQGRIDDVHSFGAMGSLMMTQKSEVNTDGPGNSSVFIRGERFVINNSVISAKTQLSGTGGTVSISLTDDLTVQNKSVITTKVENAEKGANIDIEVKNLYLLDGGVIASNTEFKGNAGDVRVNAKESITISGKKGALTSAISSESLGSGDGGRIEIHTPELTVTDGGAISGIAASTGNGGHIDIHTDKLEITDGGYISSKTKGAGKGGDITISASDSIRLSGTKGGFVSAIDISNEGKGNAGSLFISSPEIAITDQATIRGMSSGTGTGADISLQTARLHISTGGDINCSTTSNGNGGNLTIAATESVSISGKQGGYVSGIYANTFRDGDAGALTISTPSLSISEGAVINALVFGDGNGANITVNAGTVTIKSEGIITTSTRGSGSAGNIRVCAAGSVHIEGDGHKSQSGIFSSTEGDGKGGDITISAGALTVENHGSINSSSLGRKPGGDIEVKVGSLIIKDRGTISSSGLESGRAGDISITATESVSITQHHSGDLFTGVFSVGAGTADAGYVSISAPTLTLSGKNALISTSTEGSGRGGRINLAVASLHVSDNAAISAKSTGPGNAGNILIESTDLISIDNAAIETKAGQAAGGDISISGNDVRLTHAGTISASVASGESGGGNVNIDAVTLVGLENSGITARADQGYGGNITINADAVFFSENSYFDASSNKTGQDGKITVNSPVLDIVNALVPLRDSFLNADELLPERCETRDPEQAGSFIVDSDEGLPPGPDELLH